MMGSLLLAYGDQRVPSGESQEHGLGRGNPPPRPCRLRKVKRFVLRTGSQIFYILVRLLLSLPSLSLSICLRV
jgi:hypothetical protein